MTQDKYSPEHLKLWVRPDNYGGENWPATYSAGVGQHRDSDCLERSNFACMLAALGGENGDSVRVVREGHWAVGWVEWIAIHQDDERALRIADEIIGELQKYPVIDEEHFSELEMEEAREVWRNCYTDKERLQYIREHRNQFDFYDFSELIACVRGEDFLGTPGELIY